MNSMKQRLEWLDAMRGFTMILVVAYHVAQSGFMESEKISASLPFLVLFRMPLFFFVSGFLAYKAKWLWTFSHLEENQGTGTSHTRFPLCVHRAAHPIPLRRGFSSCHEDSHQIRLLVYMGAPPDVPYLLRGGSLLPTLW